MNARQRASRASSLHSTSSSGLRVGETLCSCFNSSGSASAHGSSTSWIGTRGQGGSLGNFLTSREAQVDWYEAYADICGERELVYVFCMRSMAIGGAFHRVLPETWGIGPDRYLVVLSSVTARETMDREAMGRLQ
jgi:hypothetical protein